MYNKDIKKTIFWHDYETFGQDAQIDKPSQFAGIRTDEDLNIIPNSELNIFCKPSMDMLPAIEACLITKVTPQDALEKGLTENSFFTKIESVLGEPGTCGVGYNSINFDDEVTRNGLYRNFKDPYQREWKNNCSRWDLIDVFRMAHALNPNVFKLNYVKDDKNNVKKSFRLEELSVLNGIEHENAHDALSDVKATIEMAKILKTKEPLIYETLYNQRQKNVVKEVVKIGKPILSASAFFGMKHEYLEVLLPVFINGNLNNYNEIYCIKITGDLDNLLNKSASDLRDLLYKKNEDLLEGEERPPLHILKLNKCPVILPLEFLNKERAKELNINGDICRKNIKLIQDNKEILINKINEIFNNNFEYEKINDPDLMIYSGGFWNDIEKKYILRINKTHAAELMDIDFSNLQDSRIPEMLFRYVGRNFPEVFSQEEYDRWINYCINKLTIKNPSSSHTFISAIEAIEKVKKDEKYHNEESLEIINKVENYILDLKTKLNID